MRNIKLTLAYDGTEYCGWQVQPDQPTIQGTLAQVLSKITQEEVALHGAGRTDAGVHALGQVAHFHTRSQLAAMEFQRALNSLLPATIRVLAAEEVPAEFHARHSATGKTYRYRIFRGPVLPPFVARYTLHYAGPLDEQAMGEAAAHFVGEHDFTSFAATPDDESGDGQPPSAVRTIWESSVLRAGAASVASSGDDELLYRVRGRSFLRYMVRKIVGTLLEVGRGRLQPADIPRILAARSPGRSGPTAPPHGLYMEHVAYSAEYRNVTQELR